MTQPPAQERYERSDADPRPVVMAAFGLALVLVGSLAVSAWICQTLTDELVVDGRVDPLLELPKAPEGPDLQAIPARELGLQRAREEQLLTGTAWVDPVNRIVRIPVERALELSLQEGFPTATAEKAAEKR